MTTGPLTYVVTHSYRLSGHITLVNIHQVVPYLELKLIKVLLTLYVEIKHRNYYTSSWYLINF